MQISLANIHLPIFYYWEVVGAPKWYPNISVFLLKGMRVTSVSKMIDYTQTGNSNVCFFFFFSGKCNYGLHSFGDAFVLFCSGVQNQTLANVQYYMPSSKYAHEVVVYHKKMEKSGFPFWAAWWVCECGNMVFSGTSVWIFLHSPGHRWAAEGSDMLQPVTFPQDASQQVRLSLPGCCERNFNVLIIADKEKQGVHRKTLTQLHLSEQR